MPMRPNILLSGVMLFLFVGMIFAVSDVYLKEIKYPLEVSAGEELTLTFVVHADLASGETAAGLITIENINPKAQLPSGDYEKATKEVTFSQTGDKSFTLDIKAWGKFKGSSMKFKPSLTFSINEATAKTHNYDQTANVFVTTTEPDTTVQILSFVAAPPADDEPPPADNPPADDEPPANNPPADDTPPADDEPPPADNPPADDDDSGDTNNINTSNLANATPQNNSTNNNSGLNKYLTTENLLLGGGVLCCCSTVLLIGGVGGYIYYKKYYKKGFGK